MVCTGHQVLRAAPQDNTHASPSNMTRRPPPLSLPLWVVPEPCPGFPSSGGARVASGLAETITGARLFFLGFPVLTAPLGQVHTSCLEPQVNFLQ